MAKGQRDIDELAAEAARVNKQNTAAATPLPEPPGIPGDAHLFVRSNCAASKKVLATVANLHVTDALSSDNVSEDPSAKAKLEELTGKGQAPCLVLDGKPMLEAADIVVELANRVAPVG